MELYGFNIPDGNKGLENQIRDTYFKAFPNGEKQINVEVESLWNKLNKKYPFSKVKEIYIHASCLYFAYYHNGKGNISRVDEMNFFSSVRGNYDIPRIDMLIIYECLKNKPEINTLNLEYIDDELTRYKVIFKNKITEAFELCIKEKMKKIDFSSLSDAQRNIEINMIIVTVWKSFYSDDYSKMAEGTDLTESDFKDIICDVRDEMVKKYIINTKIMNTFNSTNSMDNAKELVSIVIEGIRNLESNYKKLSENGFLEVFLFNTQFVLNSKCLINSNQRLDIGRDYFLIFFSSLKKQMPNASEEEIHSFNNNRLIFYTKEWEKTRKDSNYMGGLMSIYYNFYIKPLHEGEPISADDIMEVLVFTEALYGMVKLILEKIN